MATKPKQKPKASNLGTGLLRKAAESLTKNNQRTKNMADEIDGKKKKS